MRALVGLIVVVWCAVASGCSGDDGGRTAPTTEAPPTTSELSDPPADVTSTSAPPTTAAVVGSTSTTAAPSPSTVPIDGDPSTSVAIDTGSGSVQIGGGEVPAIVDESFPLPSDFALTLASEDDDSAGFTGTTSMGFDDLIAFFETELPAAGFEAALRQVVDGRFAIVAFAGDAGSGEIAIATTPGGDGHDLTVTYAP